MAEDIDKFLENLENGNKLTLVFQSVWVVGILESYNYNPSIMFISLRDVYMNGKNKINASRMTFQVKSAVGWGKTK